MSDTIILAADFDRPTFLEAMSASRVILDENGGSSVLKGLIFSVIFGGVAMLVIRLGFGFIPDTSHFIAVIIGVLMMGGIWIWIALNQQKKLTNFAAEVAQETGPQRYVFADTGFDLTSNVGRSTVGWNGVHKIYADKRATMIMMGAVSLAVPHHSLPDGLSPDAFAAQLNMWKDA